MPGPTPPISGALSGPPLGNKAGPSDSPAPPTNPYPSEPLYFGYNYLEGLLRDESLDPGMRDFLERYHRYKQQSKIRAFLRAINIPGKFHRALRKAVFNYKMEQYRWEYAFYYGDGENGHVLP